MSATVHNNIVSGPQAECIPTHLSYAQYLFDQFKKGGNAVALICGETGNTATFNEILQKSVNLAVALRKLGVRKGDSVTLSSENRFEFTVSALAVMYVGGVLSTLNITYSPDEIIHMLNITKSKFIICSPFSAYNIHEASKKLSCVERIIQFGDEEIIPGLLYNKLITEHINIEDFTIVDVDGLNDPLVVMCSSGTTGLPKGVMLTHVNFLSVTRHLGYYFEVSVKQKNHSMTTMTSVIPWFHAYGFLTSFAVLALNYTVVFSVRFQEELFLSTIQKYKINMLIIVPPIAVFLAKHPMVAKYDLTSVNEVWCGAAPLSRDLVQSITDRLGIPFIRQGYGLTEATMACCVDLSTGDKIGSCGTPAPGMKIKVVDIENGKNLGPNEKGELCIKSPQSMKGYMGVTTTEEVFDSEGYVKTGDIGYYDADGYFYIVDRLKELIKYKGFQVAPAELEAILLKHKAVRECGVVGTPDELAGELPTAVVVTEPGVTVTEQELVDYVASKVSTTKRLRGGVIFANEIPKNATGKILRREIREMFVNTKSKL